MKDATISTSRTRATHTDTLTYRPLDPSWGDAEELRAVREMRTRAAQHGGDPSTVTTTGTTADRAPGERSHQGGRSHGRPGLFRRLFRTSGHHSRSGMSYC